MSCQRAWTASSSAASPVSTATSIAPASRYSWRTACPATPRASRTGSHVLPVRAAEPSGAQQAVAATVDVEPGELEVAGLARHPEQLDERHLDLGVAVDAVGAVRPQGRVDGVCRAAGNGQQPVVAERPVPGDRRLDEMADAVQLVAELQVAVFAPRRQDLDERVEVAVVSLRRGDEVDRLVGHGRDAVVPRPPELPAHALEPLVDVRVEERERPVEHDPERAVAPGRGPGREPEVLEVAGLDQLLEGVRQRPLAVRTQPLGPEAAGDRHVLPAERAKPADGPRRRQDGRDRDGRAGRPVPHRHAHGPRSRK